MSDARELAEWLLYTGNGLYTEVDICTEDGTVETIRGAISSWDGLSSFRYERL